MGSGCPHRQVCEDGYSYSKELTIWSGEWDYPEGAAVKVKKCDWCWYITVYIDGVEVASIPHDVWRSKLK